MGTKRYELTESEWNRIKDMLPPEHPKEGKRGRPAKCDNRSAMNGILWIARGGAPWRELPERYGPWQTIYSRFRKWKDMGIFEAIFKTLSIDADFENISIDSTSCKVHQNANGGEKIENKAVGMSRGGRNTKIHTLVDGLGNPLAFMLSSGNDHDSVHAVSLLSQVDIERSNILGDKAYGAKAIREYIVSQRATYTIPPKSDVSDPWPIDWHTYRERHLVECFFQKLKWFRRIFTRYDKLDSSFLAFVYIGAIAILLK